MFLYGDQIFVDFSENKIKDESGKPFTLRTAAMSSLVATLEDEKGLSGEEKLKRFELAMKIKNHPDPIEVTSEDTSLIKKMIARVYTTLIVGQAWQMLEGKKGEVHAIKK